MFGRKKKPIPPPLPDPVVVAIRDLEKKLLEVQAEVLSCKVATKLRLLELVNEIRQLREENAALRQTVDRKRVIRMPLTLTVSKTTEGKPEPPKPLERLKPMPFDLPSDCE